MKKKTVKKTKPTKRKSKALDKELARTCSTILGLEQCISSNVFFNRDELINETWTANENSENEIELTDEVLHARRKMLMEFIDDQNTYTDLIRNAVSLMSTIAIMRGYKSAYDLCELVKKEGMLE